jgi:hypothetical protein
MAIFILVFVSVSDGWIGVLSGCASAARRLLLPFSGDDRTLCQPFMQQRLLRSPLPSATVFVADGIGPAEGVGRTWALARPWLSPAPVRKPPWRPGAIGGDLLASCFADFVALPVGQVR